VWDVRTGKQLAQMENNLAVAKLYGYHSSIKDLLAVPGQDLLIATGERGTVLWDAKTYQPVHDFDMTGSFLSIDAKGQRLAVAHEGWISIFDLPGRRELSGEKILGADGYCVTLNAKGDAIVGSMDSTIRRFSAASRPIKLFKEEDREVEQANRTGAVCFLAPSPEQDKALVCCSQKPWMMDLSTGERLENFTSLPSLRRATWSPDGKTIAAANEKSLYLLDSSDMSVKWSVPLPGDYHCSHCGPVFSSDGAEVYSTSSNVVCRFSAADGKQLFPSPDQPLRNVALQTVFVPGTDLLVESGGDPTGRVRLVDRKSGSVKAEYLVDRMKNYRVYSAVSADSKFLLVRKEGVNHVFELTGGKELLTVAGAAGDYSWFPRYMPSCISPDGQNWMLLDDKELKVSNVVTGQVIYRQEASKALGLIAGPGQRVAMISPKVVSILNFNGQTLQSFSGSDFRCCAFLPAPSQALLISTSKEIYLYRGQGQLLQPRKLSPAEIQQAVKQLGDSSFKTREEATELLIAGGEDVLPALKEVKAGDAEVKNRLLRVENGILACNYTVRDCVHVGAEDPSQEQPASEQFNIFWELAVHPDGRHFAALLGEQFHYRIVLGRIDGDKISLLGLVPSEDMADSIQFDERGMLIAGCRNGTTAIYDTGPGGQELQAVKYQNVPIEDSGESETPEVSE
jgi:hypothetical protein